MHIESQQPTYAPPEVVKRIMNKVNLGPVKFAQSIGMRYQRINDIANGRSKKISPEIIAAICKRYPFVNSNFLYTGEGELFQEVPEGCGLPGEELTVSELRELRQLHRDILTLQQQVIQQQQQMVEKDARINERERALLQRERELNEREALIEMRESESVLKNAQSA